MEKWNEKEFFFSLITFYSHLVKSLLPAVLPFYHQFYAVGQSREDPCCGGLEGDGFTLKVDPVHPFGTGRGKHWHRRKQRCDRVRRLPHKGDSVN